MLFGNNSTYTGYSSLTVCGCWFTRPDKFRIREYLPQVELESNTTILSTTSRTTLTQTFVNPHETPIPEAQYTFPLYDGVSVVAFKCTVGQRNIVGVVKEKQQAKAEYNEAVKRGETAGLLEQMSEAADVFSTKIGNIPQGATVVVEIVYLGELKQDAEKDGVRFTIPTAIAPRYGNVSQSTKQSLQSNVHNRNGIKIVVEVTVETGSVIRGLQSPSHPIAITMGRNSVQDESVFQNNLASATLSLSGKAELDKDFVIIVNAQGQDVPRALLEIHPKHGRALMTTLVPKFGLPNIHPEIVFIVDRSGSMDGKIEMVVQALKVFLKSLPTSAKFNICSFGSNHSFLFPKSKPYDESSLNEALQHLESFQANYGGTELQKPIEQTVKQRLKGVPLEMMVLTDGQIWNQQALFSFVQEASKKQVRTFSLGIGSGASTSLVEGMARAGDGFAQFVQDGEQMDKRVMRMLKAALTPHITDYTLEVKYGAESSVSEEDFELIESFNESMETLVTSSEKPVKKAISLFTNVFKEQPTNPLKGRYDHLPSVAVPKILQTPHKIPALYAFNRTTIYLLFGPAASERGIKSVVLRGSCEHGPLELEIPVQTVVEGETIHQLAAKKAIQELEEGRGWIAEAMSANGKTLKSQYDADWERIVEREAVRLGTQFQVVGKYCSFVAIETDSKEINGTEKLLFADTTDEDQFITGKSKERKKSMKMGMRMPGSTAPAPAPTANALFIGSPVFSSTTDVDHCRRKMESSSSVPSLKQPNPMAAFPPPSRSFFRSSQQVAAPPGSFGSIGIGGGLFGRSAQPAGPPATFGSSTTGMGLFGNSKPLADHDASILNASSAEALFGGSGMSHAFNVEDETATADGSMFSFSGRSESLSTDILGTAPGLPDTGKAIPEQLMHTIISLQQFNGSWAKSSEILRLIEVGENEFASSMVNVHSESVKTTAMVLAWLEVKVASEKEIWEMIAEKARSWLVSQDGTEDAEMLVELARNVIH